MTSNQTPSERNETERMPPTTILDLGDKLLRDIFEQLDGLDLNAVADVCTTFRSNAMAVFSSKFKSQRFEIWIHEKQMPQLRSIIRNFGRLMKNFSLELDRSLYVRSSEIFKLLNNYCGESLTKLSLQHIKFTPDDMSTIMDVFKRLHELQLHRCWWTPKWLASEMFSQCLQLRKLNVADIQNHRKDDLDFPARVRVPQMTTFSLNYCPSASIDAVEDFLAENEQLRDIEIVCCRRITSHIIDSIIAFVPNVERLSIQQSILDRDFIENAMKLKRLRQLKALELHGNRKSIFPILHELTTAQIPLEKLRMTHLSSALVGEISKMHGSLKHLGLFNLLVDMRLPDLVKLMENLPALNSLYLDYPSIRSDDLVEIVRRAPNLRELEILIEVTPKFYAKLVAVIAARPCKWTLKVIAPPSSIRVPIHTLELNQHLVRVKAPVEE